MNPTISFENLKITQYFNLHFGELKTCKIRFKKVRLLHWGIFHKFIIPLGSQNIRMISVSQNIDIVGYSDIDTRKYDG